MPASPTQPEAEGSLPRNVKGLFYFRQFIVLVNNMDSSAPRYDKIKKEAFYLGYVADDSKANTLNSAADFPL